MRDVPCGGVDGFARRRRQCHFEGFVSGRPCRSSRCALCAFSVGATAVASRAPPQTMRLALPALRSAASTASRRSASRAAATVRGAPSTAAAAAAMRRRGRGISNGRRGRRGISLFSATASSSSSSSSSTPASSIYGNPALYELAFGFRDFDDEVAFVKRVSETLGVGAFRSMLELGAGPAWHTTSAASIDGVRAVAVDLDAAMVTRANERIEEAGLGSRATAMRGDMIRLDVDATRRALAEMMGGPGGGASDESDGFDAACVLLGTASHLVETADAIATFESIGRCLKPGGVCVLELEHPYDLFDGGLLGASFFSTRHWSPYDRVRVVNFIP